jgi:plastocyanin
MTRGILAGTAVLAISLTIAATALGNSTGTVTLKGTVGPGFTIKLTKGGKKVTSLTHGKYKFVISDKSSNHSFALDGPHGFAKDFTTIPFVGTKTATLTLKKGSYKYYCKNHESIMFAHFTVK